MQALTGGSISIPTLDGRTLQIYITDIVFPGYEKRVVGEGMPLVDEPNKFGDLIIQFQIQFPLKLTPRQKQLMREALS